MQQLDNMAKYVRGLFDKPLTIHAYDKRHDKVYWVMNSSLAAPMLLSITEYPPSRREVVKCFLQATVKFEDIKPTKIDLYLESDFRQAFNEHTPLIESPLSYSNNCVRTTFFSWNPDGNRFMISTEDLIAEIDSSCSLP